jgi:hypothetical protein
VIYDSESKDSFSLHLPIHHPHHLPKLLLGENPLLDKQSDKSLLRYHLGHEELFKGNDLFRIKTDCHKSFHKQPSRCIISPTNTTKPMAAHASIEC